MYNLEKIGKTLNSNPKFKGVYMETSNMKNMVVLKNLPSNLVEEAIVILKSTKKAKNQKKQKRKANQEKQLNQ